MGLSSTEKIAVQALIKEAQRTGVTKRAWASDSQLARLDLDSTKEQAVTLEAPISKVQKALEKPMKPNRSLLSVVRYKNGAIEQLTEKTTGLLDSENPESEPEKKPAAAVTVAQPTLGCPAPDFEKVDLRANAVLRAFLTPQQVADFESDQAFVQRGADTGHTYIITSRNAPDALKRHQSYRSLYDLTERRAYCVHDWTIPAGEEMLTLALFVGTPGNESYVRAIPDL